MTNYDRMAADARNLFLRYDLDAICQRLALCSDSSWIWLVFAGRPYRICRRSAVLETVSQICMPDVFPSKSGSSIPCPKTHEEVSRLDPAVFTKAAGPNETLSVFEILTRSSKRPGMTGEWLSMTQLAGVAGAAPTDLSGFLKDLALFEGNTELLGRACEMIGGIPKKGADVSVLLPVFDGLLTWFQYWEGDDEFPPAISFLWDRATREHLGYETVWYVIGFLVNEMRLAGERVLSEQQLRH